RVGDAGEHDRDRAAFPLQGADVQRAVCEDHVWLEGDQLFREHLHLSAGRRKAIVDADIVAFRPSTLFKPLPKSYEARLCFRIVLGEAYQHTNTPHAFSQLRAGCTRPRGRAAEQSDELASFQLSKLHSLPPSQGQSLADWYGASARRTAAFRKGLCPVRINSTHYRI